MKHGDAFDKGAQRSLPAATAASISQFYVMKSTTSLMHLAARLFAIAARQQELRSRLHRSRVGHDESERLREPRDHVERKRDRERILHLRARHPASEQGAQVVGADTVAIWRSQARSKKNGVVGQSPSVPLSRAP